ncbi:hypothetical protein ACRAKJ_24880 [Saccharothrix sp. DSM 118769]
MIYLHTSALVRLAAGESDPVATLLREADDGIALSSELTRVELDAVAPSATVLARARAVLDAPAVVDVEVSDLIREVAASLADEVDAAGAVHLATALSLGTAVTAFACADPPLVAAAAARGMRPVVPPFGAPGLSGEDDGNREGQYRFGFPR